LEGYAEQIHKMIKGEQLSNNEWW